MQSNIYNIESLPIYIIINISKYCDIRNLLYCNKKLYSNLNNKYIRKHISNQIIINGIYSTSIHSIREKVRKSSLSVEEWIKKLEACKKVGYIDRHLILSFAILKYGKLKSYVNIFKKLNQEYWNYIVILESLSRYGIDLYNLLIEEDVVLKTTDKTLNVYTQISKVLVSNDFIESKSILFLITYDKKNFDFESILEDTQNVIKILGDTDDAFLQTCFQHKGIMDNKNINQVKSKNFYKCTKMIYTRKEINDSINSSIYRNIFYLKYNIDYCDFVLAQNADTKIMQESSNNNSTLCTDADTKIIHESIPANRSCKLSNESSNNNSMLYTDADTKIIQESSNNNSMLCTDAEAKKALFHRTILSYVEKRINEHLCFENVKSDAYFYLYNINCLFKDMSLSAETISDICSYMILSNVYKNNPIKINDKYKIICSIYLGNYNNIAEVIKNYKNLFLKDYLCLNIKSCKMDVPVDKNILNLLYTFNIFYFLKALSIYLNQLFKNEITFSDNFLHIKRRTYIKKATELVSDIDNDHLLKLISLSKEIKKNKRRTLIVNTLAVILNNERKIKIDELSMEKYIISSFRIMLKQTIDVKKKGYIYSREQQHLFHSSLLVLFEFYTYIDLKTLLIIHKSDFCTFDTKIYKFILNFIKYKNSYGVGY